MYIRWLDSIVILLSKACFFLAAICLFLIAAYGVLDVIFSLSVGGGLPVTREASSALLAAAVFLSFGYSQLMKQDIRIDLVFIHMPPLLRKFSECISLLFGIVVFGLLTWQSWESFIKSWAIGETAMALYRFPIYPSKLALALGSAAAALELLRQFIGFLVFRAECEGGKVTGTSANPDTLSDDKSIFKTEDSE